MDAIRSTIRHALFGLTAAASLASLPAQAGEAAPHAGEASKQSDVGAFAGLMVGAAAAGPVGAVLGAAGGALLGDHYHRQQQSAAALAANLKQTQAQSAQLASRLSELDSSLARAQAHESELGDTLQQADRLGLDVGFRTDDDTVAEDSLEPLLKLGALAHAMPQSMVRVAGYADPRGSRQYNEALSLRRAQGVAAVLTRAGVAPERILIEAHGKSESLSASGDLDGYALERRVSVRLELGESGEVARRE